MNSKSGNFSSRLRDASLFQRTTRVPGLISLDQSEYYYSDKRLPLGVKVGGIVVFEMDGHASMSSHAMSRPGNLGLRARHPMETVEAYIFYGLRKGEGGRATVYEGVYYSNLVAMKVAMKQLDFRRDRNYYEEAQVHCNLRHENIVKFIGLIFIDSRFTLVLELAEGGNLAGAIHGKKLAAPQKLSTIHQISKGLAYLHEIPLLHLDLKPANILFKDRLHELVLIADFGMAKFSDQFRSAGASKFRAPDNPFTRKSDVYSLACIACCIFAERCPGFNDTQELTRRIISDVVRNYDFGRNSDWHLALENGVDRNPSNRPTASQFRDSFEDHQARNPDVTRRPELPAVAQVVAESSQDNLEQPRINVTSGEVASASTARFGNSEYGENRRMPSPSTVPGVVPQSKIPARSRTEPRVEISRSATPAADRTSRNSRSTETNGISSDPRRRRRDATEFHGAEPKQKANQQFSRGAQHQVTGNHRGVGDTENDSPPLGDFGSRIIAVIARIRVKVWSLFAH